MSNTSFIDLEGHIIRSSMEDEHQIVKITEKVPEIKNIGKIVCGDTYSNIITFEINRYYDNVDLLTKRIKFIVKNELGTFTEDSVNTQYNDNLLRFSWILSDSVTYKSGDVKAAIIFLGTESDRNYALKTIPFTLKIDNSLDLVDIEPPHKNWFSDIENRLSELEDNGVTSNGNDGESAYEIAKNNGFVGTEQEWLNSLRGTGIFKITKINTVGLVDTYRITFTDGNVYDFDVNNGSKGQDGTSPTIGITTIDGGHRVTITDKNGTDSFDIMDGISIPKVVDYNDITNKPSINGVELSGNMTLNDIGIDSVTSDDDDIDFSNMF